MKVPVNVFIFQSGSSKRLCLCIPGVDPFSTDHTSGVISTYESADTLKKRIKLAELSGNDAERLLNAVKEAYDNPHSIYPVPAVEMNADQMDAVGFTVRPEHWDGL